MFEGFRSRLVLSNLLITLVGLLVVVAVFSQVLQQSTTDARKGDRAAQAQALAREVDTLYSHGATLAELRREMGMAGRLLGVQVLVYGPYGGVPKINIGSPTPYDTGSWHPLNRETLRKGESYTQRLKSKNLYLFQSPIIGTHGHQREGGAVELVVKVGDVRPDAASLTRVVAIVAGTAVLVWLLIGLYFALSISRPLARIKNATTRMALGDYGVRVPTRGEGEIARLAAGFNHMAEKVQDSNRVLRDFVANVSHDLRTPLTIIGGFSQAMLDGTADGAEIQDSAVVIHEEAEKMRRLVDDLLALTRLESGLQTLQRHPVEVQPMVQALVQRIQRAHAEGTIPPLRNLVPTDVPPIQVDDTQIERALRNLLDNALQYTPPDGMVSVSAAPVGPGWIEIAVTDTGVGIAPEDLQRVFERFYRSDRSRERVHGHSGLGLAIVREIVEAHGGTVHVESQPGRGTTFRCILPAAPIDRHSVEDAAPTRSTASIGAVQ